MLLNLQQCVLVRPSWGMVSVDDCCISSTIHAHHKCTYSCIQPLSSLTRHCPRQQQQNSISLPENGDWLLDDTSRVRRICQHCHLGHIEGELHVIFDCPVTHQVFRPCVFATVDDASCAAWMAAQVQERDSMPAGWFRPGYRDWGLPWGNGGKFRCPADLKRGFSHQVPTTIYVKFACPQGRGEKSS